jgi:protoporphyrin/coproporphyrin ferrochelatase
MSQSYQAVLLIAFGGPTGTDEIGPFLARITRGIAIPPERLEEVVAHYKAVGGKSPLNEITARQAQALEKLLDASGAHLPVYVGLRNSKPFFVDVLQQMTGDGVERALGFILSSYQTEASWGRYQQNISDARAELGGEPTQIEYCPGWHDHPLFIQTWTELIQNTLDQIPNEHRQSVAIIFTAHSLPGQMASRSPYVEQLHTTARLIAGKLALPSWSLAFQSRSGKATDHWLEPDINRVIAEAAPQKLADAVIAPIGFVSDHVEVLYDLDIEAKATADAAGIRLHRVRCPNDHPAFIRMMADVILSTAQSQRAK